MPKFPSILKRPLRAIRRLIHDRRGAAAIMLAVALSGIVGFAGLGTEVAAWYFTTRAMQGAASSAAASAAAELAAAKVAGVSVTCDQLRHTGRAIAATFNFANGTNSTTVSVNGSDSSGTSCGTLTSTPNPTQCAPSFSSSTACYIEVIISQPQAALLSAVVMPSGWTPTITARAEAQANTGATGTGCVLALNGVASRAANAGGTGTLTFNGCSIYSNSNASDGIYVGGSGVVSAQGAYVVGHVNGTVHTDPAYGTNTGVNPTVDPYANVTMPSSSTTCSGWSNYVNGNGNLHITNGTYTLTAAGGTCALPNDIQMDGGTLTLCPGIYVFNGGHSLTMNSTSVLNAPPQAGPIPPATTPPMSSTLCPNDTSGGVTIVFVNSSGNPGTISVGGQASVNIDAPSSTTVSTHGIAIFQQRTTCTTNGNGNGGCPAQLVGGGNQNVNGAIYFRNNAISYAGGSSTGSQCTQIVANTITFTGGSTFNSDCQSLGGQTINNTNGTLVM